MLRRSFIANSGSSLFATPRLLCAAAGGPAPKKPTRRLVVPKPAAVGSSAANSSSSSSQLDPLVDAKLSTDRLREAIDKLDPEQLAQLQQQVSEQDKHEQQVLEQDSLYQMDVSLKQRHQTVGLRVFWKNIKVVDADDGLGGYFVLLDGRKVKAFESTHPLRLPTEDYAHAVAKEFSYQQNTMNKLLMPLTDLASGAQMVAPQMIPPRVNYLMSFFQNDNCYFRSADIADQQDAAIRPVAEFFERATGVVPPRLVGLAHPRFTEAESEAVRHHLHGLQMNQYQVVAFCVAAQFTASVMLPLALFSRIITVERALEINRMEEGHNIRTHGHVTGYHDIRESDVRVKIAAAAFAWRATSEVGVLQAAVASPSAGQEVEMP
jgi:chaperone required for assembly of F1-ATPase